MKKTSLIEREDWIYVVLIVLTLATFWSVRQFEFLNLDDDGYILNSARVQQGFNVASVAWAFTTGHMSNWHPMTWLSYMLDYSLFGLNPRGYHVVNVLLHTANVVLLFTLLLRMTGALGCSAFVAAMFAIHPLHVESVAWIAERKDVLSGLFWMLGIMAYALYVRQPGKGRYAVVAFVFALGLMSKPMAVTFPCVLLLLDYWPLKRLDLDAPVRPQLTRLALEKAPLLAMSVGSSVVTIVMQQRSGALDTQSLFPFKIRVANAVASYGTYLLRTFYPVDLYVPYPHPGFAISPWHVAIAATVLAFVTVLAFRWARRAPYFVVGWLWFLGTLVPAIGLIQAGSQGMADRYTYLPLIGVFIILAWGASDLLGRWKQGRIALTAAALAVTALLAGATMFQLQYWRNTVALFEHALSINDENTMAHNNLGSCLLQQNRVREAAGHFSRAIEIAPTNTDALNNLGVAVMALGNFQEAVDIFQHVLQTTPDDATVHSNLGVAYLQLNDLPKAKASIEQALRLDPSCDKARQVLGLIEGKMRQ